MFHLGNFNSRLGLILALVQVSFCPSFMFLAIFGCQHLFFFIYLFALICFGLYVVYVTSRGKVHTLKFMFTYMQDKSLCNETFLCYRYLLRVYQLVLPSLLLWS
jgi:hypothetical protein